MKELKQGSLITNQEDIIYEQAQFDTDLYRDKRTEEKSKEELLQHIIKKFSPEAADILEDKLSLFELKAALFQMDHNKSLGPDALNVQFLRCFGMILRTFSQNSLKRLKAVTNYAIQ